MPAVTVRKRRFRWEVLGEPCPFRRQAQRMLAIRSETGGTLLLAGLETREFAPCGAITWIGPVVACALERNLFPRLDLGRFHLFPSFRKAKCGELANGDVMALLDSLLNGRRVVRADSSGVNVAVWGDFAAGDPPRTPVSARVNPGVLHTLYLWMVSLGSVSISGPVEWPEAGGLAMASGLACMAGAAAILIPAARISASDAGLRHTSPGIALSSIVLASLVAILSSLISALVSGRTAVFAMCALQILSVVLLFAFRRTLHFRAHPAPEVALVAGRMVDRDDWIHGMQREILIRAGGRTETITMLEKDWPRFRTRFMSAGGLVLPAKEILP